MQSVIHPLALSAVRQQAASSQLCEMPGDFWLTLVQRAGQLAHTKLSFTGDEHHRAHPSVVSQAFENSGRCQMVSHIIFSVFVFDQDEHLDALMNFVKRVAQCVGFGERIDLSWGGAGAERLNSAYMRFIEYMILRMQGKAHAPQKFEKDRPLSSPTALRPLATPRRLPSPLVCILVLTATAVYMGLHIGTVGDMGSLPDRLPIFMWPDDAGSGETRGDLPQHCIHF